MGCGDCGVGAQGGAAYDVQVPWQEWGTASWFRASRAHNEDPSLLWQTVREAQRKEFTSTSLGPCQDVCVYLGESVDTVSTLCDSAELGTH